MVRNKCWVANNAVGLPKQSNSYQSSLTFLCFLKKSNCVICVPAQFIPYHVTGSCKRPIQSIWQIEGLDEYTTTPETNIFHHLFSYLSPWMGVSCDGRHGHSVLLPCEEKYAHVVLSKRGLLELRLGSVEYHQRQRTRVCYQASAGRVIHVDWVQWFEKWRQLGLEWQVLWCISWSN